MMSGQAEKIATGVLVDESQRGLMAGASHTGTLVWAGTRPAETQFVWLDRSGRRLGTVAIEPGHVFGPRLSPDGAALLYTRVEKGNADLFLHDLKTGSTRRITTDPGYDENPCWMPDGRAVLYHAKRSMQLLRLDSSTPPTKVFDRETSDVPEVTPDGRFALLAVATPSMGSDLWAVTTSPPHAATELLSAPGDQLNVHASPDGHWVMWSSAESGTPETYLARLVIDGGPPHLGTERIPVSSGGGTPIGWRSDGREILYVSKTRDVVAVPVTLRPEAAVLGTPSRLFTMQDVVTLDPIPIATADASRFIVSQTPFAKGQHIHVLTNWFARLADKSR